MALALAGLLATSPLDRAIVPLELQVALLSKVLLYDRNFAARAGPEANLLVVYAPDDPDSERVARELLVLLRAQSKLGGVAHRLELVVFEGAAALATLVKKRNATLVVFGPGIAAKAREVSSALEGQSCLTVTTTPGGVAEGVVLGFDLISGKPKMLFNLSQARRQNIDFRAEALQLMTVFP